MAHNCQGDQESLEQSQSVSQPSLCAAGCGFFANAGTPGNSYCSKCSRELAASAERRASNSKAAVAALSETSPPVGLAANVPISRPASPTGVVESPSPAPQVSSPPTQQPPSPAPDPEVAVPSTSQPAVASEGADLPPREKPVQKNTSRCWVCKKKIGLTGFKCKCEFYFCGAHRLGESHNCPFDYKTMERQRLALNNPLIQAAKMDKM